MSYSPAIYCRNGHFITTPSKAKIQPSNFCQQCGAAALDKGCEHCGTFPSLEGPGAYCGNCGKPYPWTPAR